ncbi:7949_t:CDS:2 [Paraglomus brasilianum]|uniref:7949_t:CDS:1 n=1 Tax=Paraglomus brasilianum TaxID=144538 RepID=A0A9N8ZYK5_9GLOM|nr:7949_t:CDS:2 [Paraglomus brasilianum]
MTDERIVLNVGGMKYETYRSTLTQYPDTHLGTMFQERNKDMLHPSNGNEYFFDRDGRAFYYIMEYYRKGTVPYYDDCSQSMHCNSVSRMQLEGELDYFQIPKPSVIEAPLITVTEEYAAQLLDNFIDMVKKVLREAQFQLYSRVSMTFVSKSFEDFAIAPGIESAIRLATPYAFSGYRILRNFPELSEHLKEDSSISDCYIQKGFRRVNSSLEVLDRLTLTIVSPLNLEMEVIKKMSCLGHPVEGGRRKEGGN